MENKYYTPAIEEFHEGFEFEVNNAPNLSDEWTPVKISGLRWFPSDAQLVSLKIRVKYLDQKDIESLGWRHTGGKLMKGVEDFFELPYKDPREEHDRVQLLFRNGWCLICTGNYKLNYDQWSTRFSGHVKNKSRLKLVMEMLGITQ